MDRNMWTHLKIIIITGISDIMTVSMMVIMRVIMFMHLKIIIIITGMSWMDRIIWTLKTIIITGISCIMWTHLRTHRHAQTNTDLQDRSRAQRFILPRCNAICAPRLRLLKHASMAALSCRTRRPNCKGE